MTSPAEQVSSKLCVSLVGRGAGKMGERNTNVVGTEAPHGKCMTEGRIVKVFTLGVSHDHAICGKDIRISPGDRPRPRGQQRGSRRIQNPRLHHSSRRIPISLSANLSQMQTTLQYITCKKRLDKLLVGLDCVVADNTASDVENRR